MQKYIFEEYNPEYKEFFVQEKEKLSPILSSDSRIEHVGSTAIPGLGGKGILDIIIGVPRDMRATKKELEKAGYEYREKASYPERFFFRVDYPHKNGYRRVHIHLVLLNSQDWKEIVGFRDYLLQHPEEVEEYARIKQEGVKKAQGDGESYRQHKQDFIDKILNKLNDH